MFRCVHLSHERFLGTGVPIFEIRETAGDTDMLVRNPALGRRSLFV